MNISQMPMNIAQCFHWKDRSAVLLINGKKCVFFIIWRNNVVCLRFYGENIVNLVIRIVNMKTVWRQCEE